jgi:hypothetical protein
MKKKIKTLLVTWTLRFYNQPKKLVDTYMSALEKRWPTITDYRMGPITISVNILGGFDRSKSYEVTIYFKDKQSLTKFLASAEEKQLYCKAAYIPGKAKFVELGKKTLVRRF